MPQIESADEAKSVARLIQGGQITGTARDSAMQALRDFDTAHVAATQHVDSNGTDWLRQIALAGRAVGEGVMSIPASFSDFVTGKSVGDRVAERLTGQHVPSTQEELSAMLTNAGAPTPTTPGEQLASAGISGASGALAGGGASGAVGAIRAGVSGLTSGLASEGAKQAGFGKWAQIAAGLVGGLTPSALEGAGHLATSIARPVTRSGQQQIASNVMASQASDPQAAAANLDAAVPIVPGSARNTGEASQDIGLLALEKGVRGRNTASFGQRISEQNAARQAELTALGGKPTDIAAAKAARDAATTPMREQAFIGSAPNTGIPPVKADIAPIHAKIDEILASPVGKRETVSKSLEWARDQIGSTTDPAALYEIRKDLQLAQQGKLQPSSPTAPNASTLALARGQLGDVVSTLDNQIEAAAPGFKAYLQRYKDMSVPIDQKRIIQEIQKRSQLSSADITTGQTFIGNQKFSNQLDAAIQKNPGKLTPDQTQRLNAIRTDLQYGQAINSPLVKAPGSDTFQNLSIAQVIGAGATSAHPALQVLGKPLQWVYKLAGSDDKVNELLAQAMLDPRLASQMLKRATAASTQKFSEAFRVFALQHGVGVAAGTNATLGQSPADRSSSPGIQ